MLACMDEEAERRTRDRRVRRGSGAARASAVAQGRDVGQHAAVDELRDDCDGDALLVRVDARRPDVPHGQRLVLRARALAHDRRAAAERPEGSYTAELLDAGVGACARKVGEEAVEVTVAALDESDERVVEEARRPRLPPVRPPRGPGTSTSPGRGCASDEARSGVDQPKL
jgi:phosphoribosyl-ATP pyrophosphohydrolase